MTTRLVIAFNPDLTDPTSKGLNVGVITLEDGKYVNWQWVVDPFDLAPAPKDTFLRELVATWPLSLRLMATESWAEAQAYVWDGRGTEPPKTLTEYLCRNLEHSSFFVSRIEEDGPVFVKRDAADWIKP